MPGRVGIGVGAAGVNKMTETEQAIAKKTPNQNWIWFVLGMMVILGASLGLRFWGLGRFNTLVFDEVYYAVFSNNYLIGKEFFNAHPPLSQYIIAFGMWLGSKLPIGQDTVNDLTGSWRSTFSYRWLNALTGSFIPVVVGAIAYQLYPRGSFALVAALFAALDGLFLVESRYALNNVYLVILGLLGHLVLILALKTTGTKRWLQLAISGILLGACITIKWNGLWFLLGIYFLWFGAWIFVQESSASAKSPLARLRQINLWQFAGLFGILPVLTYSLLWIPHLLMNPNQLNFWDSQREILSFHERIGNTPDVHPYCSPWYSWLVMWRPVAYFYETALNLSDPVPRKPPLAPGTGPVVYAVHAMGNPFLWWLSTAAILLLIVYLGKLLWNYFKQTGQSWSPEGGLVVYLVVNWAANLLPWARVNRCIFLYHYMGASVFAGLALAWIVDRWLQSGSFAQRLSGTIVITGIVIAFLFWLPVYLGLPLSVPDYQLRMWFRNWI